MDVFLSYARSTAQRSAADVYRELGSQLAFLDTEDIEFNDQFPQRLVDALLASRVVVVFADTTYFKRWYCILEFRAALSPFTYLTERGTATSTQRSTALEGVVVVLPPNDQPSLDEWNLPPELQRIQWARADDPVSIAAMVRSRLAGNPQTLKERIDATVGGSRFRRDWLEVARLPPPEIVPAEVPFVYPSALRRSLDKDFMGRLNDLWRIHNALTSPVPTAEIPSVSLEGSAAVGKSTLAREYLYRFGPRYYPGGLFWIDALRPLEPQYAQILYALAADAPRSKMDREELASRLIAAFRGLSPERPALVVVDNIPEPQSGETPALLEDWFPPARFTRILVTSRNSSRNEPGVLSLQIGVLDDLSAQAILTRNINFHALDQMEWQEIVSWVGGLPLALELLNRALLNHAFTTAEILELARSEGTTAVLDEAMDALRPALPAGSLKGATEALSFSYDRLPQSAQEAARLIAWLATAPIPEALQTAISENRFERTVRSLLVSRSFVIGSAESRVPTFGSMHAVVADFLRTKSKSHKQELTILTKALLSLMYPDQIQNPSAWSLMAACEPHAAAVFVRLAEEESRLDFVDHISLLATALVLWYMAQGRSRAAAQLALNTLTLCSVETEDGTAAPVMESLGVQHILRLLPEALARDEQIEAAIQMQRIYLEWVDQHHKKDDPESLAPFDNLADLLRRRGTPEDLAEAYEILSRNVEFWRNRDPFSKHTLTALNNLALVEEKRGETARAIRLFEEVLDSLRGLDNVVIETMTTKQNLGEALLPSDKPRAIGLLQEALSTSDSIELPDTHILKLRLLQALGVTAHLSNDLIQARDLLRRVVSVLATTSESDDPTLTDYAWRLYDSEIRSGEAVQASNTRSRYLEWLFTDDENLTDSQVQIRNHLRARDL